MMAKTDNSPNTGHYFILDCWFLCQVHSGLPTRGLSSPWLSRLPWLSCFPSAFCITMLWCFFAQPLFLFLLCFTPSTCCGIFSPGFAHLHCCFVISPWSLLWIVYAKSRSYNLNPEFSIAVCHFCAGGVVLWSMFKPFGYSSGPGYQCGRLCHWKKASWFWKPERLTGIETLESYRTKAHDHAVRCVIPSGQKTKQIL